MSGYRRSILVLLLVAAAAIFYWQRTDARRVAPSIGSRSNPATARHNTSWSTKQTSQVAGHPTLPNDKHQAISADAFDERSLRVAHPEFAQEFHANYYVSSLYDEFYCRRKAMGAKPVNVEFMAKYETVDHYERGEDGGMHLVDITFANMEGEPPPALYDVIQCMVERRLSRNIVFKGNSTLPKTISISTPHIRYADGQPPDAQFVRRKIESLTESMDVSDPVFRQRFELNLIYYKCLEQLGISEATRVQCATRVIDRELAPPSEDATSASNAAVGGQVAPH